MHWLEELKIRNSLAEAISNRDFLKFTTLLKSTSIQTLYSNDCTWYNILDVACGIDLEYQDSCFIDELLKQGDECKQKDCLFYVIRQFGAVPDQRSTSVNCLIIQKILGGAPSLVKEQSSAKRNLVHEAAWNGAEAIVPDLLQAMKKEGQIFTTAVLEAEDYGKETPLSIAVTKAIGIPGLGSEDPNFLTRESRINIVKMLVGYEKETRPTRLQALLIKSILQDDILVFTALLGSSFQLLNQEIMLCIIESGQTELWQMVAPHYPDLRTHSGLLHKAVEYGHLSLVEDLLHRCPELVTGLDSKGYSTFHYIYGSQTRDSAIQCAQDGIRKVLVQGLIRDDRMTVERIRKYLSELPGPRKKTKQGRRLGAPSADTFAEKEVSLDLSTFNEEVNNFASFVATLKMLLNNKAKHNSRETPAPGLFDLQFEPTLRYVKFPDLDRLMSHGLLPESRTTRAEVTIVLKWLRELKEVDGIFQLDVPDYFHQPHSEESLEEAIKGLGVQKLNWRRTDTSIDSLFQAAPDLTSLHLYCGGNWSALAHWTSDEEGLGKLTSLNKISIHIVQNYISETRYNDYCQRARNRLEKLQTLPSIKWTLKSDTIQPLMWGAEKPPKDDENDGHEYHLTLSPSTATQLKFFLEAYGNIQRERLEKTGSNPLKPVKIAVLDNGFALASNDIEQNQIAGNIKGGRSFLSQGDIFNHWWLVSDLHGTKMASFITELDPFCEIYIGKVCQRTRDLSVESVVKAIDWAVNEVHVDIISMSLILRQQQDSLKQAVLNAAQSAVIICSTADAGNNNPDIWPAKYDQTISIASCNYQGVPTAWSTVKGAKYLIQGENMVPLAALNLEPQQNISGSSVATAMASGLASLLLSCHQLANDENDWKYANRQDLTTQYFKKMIGPGPWSDTDSSSRYIKPWSFFPTERTSGPEAFKWIGKKFAVDGWNNRT